MSESTKRDNLEDLQVISAMPMKAVRSGLASLGHLRPCTTCESETWVIESVAGKPAPLRFEGLNRGYTVAYQVTCSTCGIIRFVDAQVVYTAAQSQKTP